MTKMPTVDADVGDGSCGDPDDFFAEAPSVKMFVQHFLKANRPAAVLGYPPGRLPEHICEEAKFVFHPDGNFMIDNPAHVAELLRLDGLPDEACKVAAGLETGAIVVWIDGEKTRIVAVPKKQQGSGEGSSQV